jgi:hypothetical protein
VNVPRGQFKRVTAYLPVLLDAIVCILVACLACSRDRQTRLRGLAGSMACAVALIAPVCAVAVSAPAWTRATAVMMMVVGFYGLVEVAGQPTGAHAALVDDVRDLADRDGRQRLWDRFDRQFAAYVEARADLRPDP